MVRETEDKDENFTGVKYEKIPDIELIREGEFCILYDPGFSLVSLAEKIYILTDGEVYGSEIEDAKAVEFVRAQNHRQKKKTILKKSFLSIRNFSMKSFQKKQKL